MTLLNDLGKCADYFKNLDGNVWGCFHSFSCPRFLEYVLNVTYCRMNIENIFDNLQNTITSSLFFSARVVTLTPRFTAALGWPRRDGSMGTTPGLDSCPPGCKGSSDGQRGRSPPWCIGWEKSSNRCERTDAQTVKRALGNRFGSLMHIMFNKWQPKKPGETAALFWVVI